MHFLAIILKRRLGIFINNVKGFLAYRKQDPLGKLKTIVDILIADVRRLEHLVGENRETVYLSINRLNAHVKDLLANERNLRLKQSSEIKRQLKELETKITKLEHRGITD